MSRDHWKAVDDVVLAAYVGVKLADFILEIPIAQLPPILLQ